MSTITTRSGKGAPLTNNEVDSNFTNLNTDKAELSGATFTGDVKLGDNDKATFGASDDLQIYHDGSNSYISEVGAGSLIIQARDAVTIEDGTSGDNYIYMQRNNKVELYHAGAAKLATTATGINVTGSVVANGFSTAGSISMGDILSIQSTTGFGSIEMGGPNGAYIDLKSPFSDDYDSRIFTNGTDLDLTCSTGSIKLIADGGQKLSTTSTGIDVTGTATMDGLVVEATTPTLTLSSPAIVWAGGESIGSLDWYTRDTSGSGPLVASRIYSYSVGSNSLPVTNLAFQTTAPPAALKTGILLEYTNDVSFYEDTGTTAKFFWDASAESLGIGTTSPEKAIHVKTAVNNTAVVRIESTAANSYPTLSLKNDAREYQLTAHGPLGDKFTIYDGTAGSHRFVIDSAGRVGIGTSSPAGVLDLGQVGSTGANTIFGVGAQSQNYFTTNTGGIHVFRRGTTEDMRIDSAGNLLVGKTSVATSTAGIELRASNLLNVTRANGQVLQLNRLSSDGEIAKFLKDGALVGSIGTRANYIKIGNGDTNLLFNSASDAITPEGVSDNRDAAVDLGRSVSRFKDLYLSGTVSGGGTYRAGNTGTGNIIIEGGQHIFRLGSGGAYAERARIDTSGNLLVGKSVVNQLGTVGTEIQSDGQLYVTSDAQDTVRLNRKTNDGTLIDFRKDGTTVGSIGARGGDVYLETGAVGLRMYDAGSAIFPSGNTGVSQDALITLGASNYRFKDLYLSGGVYLGGTGAANKLDDYEEGTFTPAITFGGAAVGLTYSVTRGSYTKVGNLVTIQIGIDVNSKGTSSGVMQITGLPFASATIAGGYSASVGSMRVDGGWTGLTGAVLPYVNESGATSIAIRQVTSTGTIAVTEANITSGYLFLSATYFTG